MADEIQNTGIQFEDIVPWVDDHGDTGLSARLKLKRNFDKIKAWMDANHIDVQAVKDLIEEYGADLFLSKINNDEAQGEMGFLEGLWVGVKQWFVDKLGNAHFNTLNLQGNATIDGLVHVDEILSKNFTGDGIADTGFRLTRDDQTGSSKLTVDNLYVRKKATFEELEVKKNTAIAGNQIYSSAANVILRTDYIDANDNLMGYSMLQVPWLLKKMPFLLRSTFFGRIRKTRLFLDAADIPRIRKVRCYFLADDDDREVYNLWKVEEYYPDDYEDESLRGTIIPGTGNDFARCQTMNLSNSKRHTYIHGMESKAGNVFWWRKLCGVSTEPVYGDDGRKYHFFDVIFDYEAEEEYRNNGQLCPWCDLSSGDIPAAGDDVVQFGNDMNPDRMNLIAVEVNSSTDAPAHKWYRGIYTFDLNRCWWGGNPRKDMISAATGVEFNGPSFRVVTEYGVAKVPKDRPEVNWNDIAKQRDDYGQHDQVRKCYNYDAITHSGSRWLCMASESVHWVRPQVFGDSDYAIYDVNGNYLHNGNYISNADYSALSADKRAQCGRVPNYTTAEPGTDNAVWKKIVAKGDQGIRGDFKSTVFVRTNTAPETPTGGSYDDPVPRGWNDGIPDGEQIVWASECTFYGAGGSSGWSTPRQMTDTADFDVEYSSVASPNPPSGHPNTNTQWSNTADSNTIWMATSEKHNGVWSDWQVQKIKGEKGDTGTRGNFKSTVFKRTNTTPDTPSGGSYTNPVPRGWSDGIPDGEEIVWASVCTFYGAGGSSGWSTPKQMTDTADFDVEFSSVASNPGNPTDNPSNWSNTATTATIWMATRECHNGTWDSWQISKIKGEKGTDGQNGRDGRDGRDGTNGVNGKDGWMITANPANVIITQNLDTQNSFTTATVGFSAKKGSVSATISSIGSLNSSTFNVEASGNSVVVKSPKSSGGVYYSEGNFTVNVYVADPDTGGTVVFGMTVFCYANLLGTWKQSIEGDVNTEMAKKISYLYDPSNPDQVVKQTTYGDFVRSSTENTSKLTKKIENGKNLFTGVTTGVDWRSESSLYFDSHPLVKASLDSDGYIVSSLGYVSHYITIERGVWYTLSFYGKVTSQVTYAVAAGSSSSSIYHIGYFSAVSSTGTKRVDKFKLSGTGSVGVFITFGVSALRYPQIEEGETATAFDANDQTVGSCIRQVADNIEFKVNQTGINIENKTITLNAEKTTITGDLTVPRVMNIANGMMTTIEAGKVRIESTTTPSYGLFQVNAAGEIVLKMVDKDGHVVANIGGSSTMQAGSWETIKLKRVDSGGSVTDSKANFTAYASDLTKYYKLTLGRVNNGGIITYYTPDGNATSDSAVIALDGYLFTSTANTASAIKSLAKVSGYYVKQNDGIFMREMSEVGEGGPFVVQVYRYISGKMNDITTHTFTS